MMVNQRETLLDIHTATMCKPHLKLPTLLALINDVR